MGIALDALVLPAFDDLEGLPGEATPWHDRYELAYSLDITGVPEPVVHDGRVGVVPTGIGKSAAASTTTALLATDMLSLDETLLLSVGVAGGPPEIPLGSVVIADCILDWDDKCRFDEGEPPLALDPYTGDQGVFDLDTALVERARAAAEDVDLRRFSPSSPEPEILRGLNVCGDELWHGHGMVEQVEWLADERGVGPYRVTQMEDAGTAFALSRFGRLAQYLSIRAVSNHDRPTDDRPASESFFDPAFEIGFESAVENAVRAARAIIEGSW